MEIDVQLALLPPPGTTVANRVVGELAGWGGTNPDARVSNHFQWAQMTTVSVESCTSAVGGGASFDTGHICTYAYQGQSACWYDYGGALVDKTNPLGTMILGVTAYAGYIDPTHPTIYTNVGYAEHHEWIQNVSAI